MEQITLWFYSMKLIKWEAVTMAIQDLNCYKFWIQIRIHHLLITLLIFQSIYQMFCLFVLLIMSKISPNLCWTECRKSSYQVTQISKRKKSLIYIWSGEPLKRQESSLINLYSVKESLIHWCKIIVWESQVSDIYRKILWKYLKKSLIRL